MRIRRAYNSGNKREVKHTKWKHTHTKHTINCMAMFCTLSWDDNNIRLLVGRSHRDDFLPSVTIQQLLLLLLYVCIWRIYFHVPHSECWYDSLPIHWTCVSAKLPRLPLCSHSTIHCEYEWERTGSGSGTNQIQCSLARMCSTTVVSARCKPLGYYRVGSGDIGPGKMTLWEAAIGLQWPLSTGHNTNTHAYNGRKTREVMHASE